MCGIFCSLSRRQHLLPNPAIRDRLASRGPDSSKTVRTVFREGSDPEFRSLARLNHVTLASTVLSLRGIRVVSQPYQDDQKRFTLCWNGEAWSVDGAQPFGNDTEVIHRLLMQSLESKSHESESETAFENAVRIASALSRVAGPYAFVLFDHARGWLYFGRDLLGRRSLLKKIDQSGDLVISSVSDGDATAEWTEIEAGRVLYVDLATLAAMDASSPFVAGQTPLLFESPFEADDSAKSVLPRLSLNKEIPPSHHPLDHKSAAVVALETLLRNSLSLRILDIPEPSCVSRRIGTPTLTKMAILFSGGLDCTLLARLSHDLLPPSESIDLLNVAFENPRAHRTDASNPASRTAAYESCPDRVTGRASHLELQQVCPGRLWRFVAIDVPYSETIAHRATVVSLMHPHNTEMDLSIAYALYFAARGSGYTIEKDSMDPESYTSPARVLLSGLGADELFAGYTRHAVAFNRGGLAGLLDELELDVCRLGSRNLGRDDRVMSHWGKEVRYPFLDEKLLSWALNAAVTEKCGFGEAAGNAGSVGLVPAKKALRCLAWRLDMQNVAKEKKRAIQFGARTAKMETGKTKGTQTLS